MRHVFPIALVIYAITSPIGLWAAGGGQPASGSTQGGIFGASPHARQPFKDLFPSPLQPRSEAVPKPRLFKVRPSPPSRTSAASVVCGMTVLPVDPTFDAAIRRPRPKEAPESIIRAVPPPPCEHEAIAGSSPRRP